MISMILPARGAPLWTLRALKSIHHAVVRLKWTDRVEFILLDDNSDLTSEISKVFHQFREATGLPIRITRFQERQHYSRVFAAGLAMSRGEKIFFLSNDMVFTPDFFRTLVEVSELVPSAGIVRGTSNYMDSHLDHQVAPPVALRGINDVLLFSQFVSHYWKQEYVDVPALSGDAVLITRKLIDAIGIVDPQYYGFFGDIDYGLRALRAGFRLVCAKGAWIFHEGGGYVRDKASRTRKTLQQVQEDRMRVVQESYKTFRNKWDPRLPEKYDIACSLDFPHLRAMAPLDRHRFVPPSAFALKAGELLN